MLTESEKSLIRQCLEGLRRGLPGYSARPGQLQMVGAIAQAFAQCREPAEGNEAHSASIVCVEAGTGIGKTAAYLMAAVVLAKSRKKHLVLSSSTIALQEQLVQKDLPAFQALWPVSFTFALAKGRGRYACLAKLHDLATERAQGSLQLDAKSQHAPAEASDELREMWERFGRGEWDGDRDALKGSVADARWNELVADRQSCTGNKCPHFAQCPFYAARERIKQADVIVANHSLVLAALRMQAGSVLPDPTETLFVFDEAHGLPAKVVELFAAQHGARGAGQWVAAAAEAVRDIVLALNLDASHQSAAGQSAQALGRHLEDLYQAIDRTRAFESQPTRRFKDGVPPEWCRTLGGNIHAAATALAGALTRLREAMLGKTGSEAYLVQRLLGGFGFYFARLENLLDTWTLMLAQDSADEPIARWLEKHEQDYLICAAPVSAAGKLTEVLWSKASAVALTSATLSACGSFEAFLRQTGLDALAHVSTLRVASPFDYRARARLVIPALKSDPRNDNAHTQEVLAMLPTLIDTQGTLCLFASGKQMQAVHARLPAPLREQILVQGQRPKGALLAEHRRRIERGERSILFGLASFAEGVDLRGAQCEHVVIAKLTFCVPTTPLEQAKAEWIERRGGSAFLEIALPECAVRLAQSVGRLLRTETDQGKVTILDRRLVTSVWGLDLLRGLPPFTLEIAGRERSLRNADLPAAA
jgi:ATP-dependent DNA helicase DinG